MAVRSSNRAPLFSVVLPTYNRPEMLKRSIASVRRQSLDDFELVVVDDGSAEDCSSFVTRLGDDRIKLICNGRNAGAGEARNRGIQAARGAYISFLDDDDEYMESFLASTLARLEDSPREVGMAWSGVQSIDYVRDDCAARVRTREFPAEYADQASLIRDFLSVGTGFGVTIKADYLAEVGGFNPGLRVVEDADLFLRLLVAGRAPVVVPGVHVIVHNHCETRLTDASTYATRARECEWLLLNYADFLFDYPFLKEQLRRQIEYFSVAARNGEIWSDVERWSFA